MSPWHLRLIADTVKAALPFQNTLRRLKRRISPYQPDRMNAPGLLKCACLEVIHLQNSGVTIKGADILEFGSGWNPIVPIVFWLMGARSVTLADQERLLDKSLIANAARFIMEGRPDVLQSRLPVSTGALNAAMNDVIAIANTSPDLETAFERLGFRYIVPFEPEREESASYDAIVSRSVLEHVSPELLDHFTREFRRILKPEGAMCHMIDLSDHWEHNDKSISRVNFLRYPDWLWRLTCINPQNYQNRLRHSEFIEIFKNAGFEIAYNEGEIHQPSIEALKSMKIDPKFARFSLEELATISAHIVARQPRVAMLKRA